MESKPKAIFNWSGGKDSTLALYQVIKEQKFEITGLLTTLNKQYNRISMHGVRSALLEQQAKSLGFPLHKIMPPEMSDMETYESVMRKATTDFKEQGISIFIFGDLFLEEIRAYRENQLLATDLMPEFPIWHYPTLKAAQDFISAGFKAVLTSVDASKLDARFAGRYFDEDLLKDLPIGVDPCGENGEFHTFVFDGPLFSEPVNFKLGETVHKSYSLNDKSVSSGFYFTDLVPA